MKVYLKHNILCFFLLGSALLARGNELKVCRNGCGYSTIQEAINAAGAGDTISVQPGLYQEKTIQVNKTLFLRGEGKAILDGEGQHEIMEVTAPGVTIQGFTFQNTGMSYLEDRAAVNVNKSKHVIVEHNIFKNTFFGIYLEKSNNCLIRNNKIYGEAKMEASSGNAIHLWYSDSATITGNEAKNHRDGIYLEFVNNSRIEDNISRGNLRYGLHFMFSDYNHYINNTFENNGAGVAVMFSKHIKMVRNRFLHNWGTASYGLLLKEIFDSEIKQNNFTKNTVGIYAEGVTRCNINGNSFSRNGWAVRMSGSSQDNVFTRNNFLSNTFDISTNARTNYNTYTGNYWSEYAGYGLDRDQIGDVPYRPVKLFSYVMSEVDASVLLLRSFFIDILNYAEKIMPSLTPADLLDDKPLMRPVK